MRNCTAHGCICRMSWPQAKSFCTAYLQSRPKLSCIQPSSLCSHLKWKALFLAYITYVQTRYRAISILNPAFFISTDVYLYIYLYNPSISRSLSLYVYTYTDTYTHLYKLMLRVCVCACTPGTQSLSRKAGKERPTGGQLPAAKSPRSADTS